MLLTQMVFAWVERWLAQRRTREIFAVLFFLAMISLQLVGPMLNRYGDRFQRTFRKMDALRIQCRPCCRRALQRAPCQCGKGEGSGPLFFALLGAYAAAILRVLGVRLRAQYRGENFSEVSRDALPLRRTGVRLGWKLPLPRRAGGSSLRKRASLSGTQRPDAADFVTPIIMLVVFGMRGRASGGGFLERTPELALPVGAGYALLLLTNLIYNNFGADGGGVQFFLASPATLRNVIVGKNLAHLAVLATEVVLLSLGVSFLFRPPSAFAVLTTIAGLMFAVPINLAAGNLLSLYAPKKIEFGTFGRQRASQTTVLASFVLQIVVFGVLGFTMFAARSYGRPWLAVVAFLAIAVAALGVYGLVLGRVDRLAMARREVLTGELCK